MRKIRVILILVTAAFFCLSTAFADETYPESFAIAEYHTGGQLIVTGSGDHLDSYLIKPNWAEESEVIYHWNGVLRQAAHGRSAGSSYIFAPHPYKNFVLCLIRDNDRHFAAILDSALEQAAITELYGIEANGNEINAEWIETNQNDEFLLIAGDNLYELKISGDEINVKLQAADVLSADIFDPGENYKYVYITKNENSLPVFFISDNGVEKMPARLSFAEDAGVSAVQGKAAVKLFSAEHRETFLQIVNDKEITASLWIESEMQLIVTSPENDKTKILYLKSSGGNYQLIINRYKRIPEISSSDIIDLPEGYIEPYCLEKINGRYYAVFRNGVITFDQNGKMITADHIPVGEYFRQSPHIRATDKFLILSTNSSSLILQKDHHPLWLINRFIANRGKYFFPAGLILIILVLMTLYRRQKRLLRQVIEMPSAGVVIYIDHLSRLQQINKNGREFLSISESIPMKRHYHFYMQEKTTEPLRDILDKGFTSRREIRQKLVVKVNGDQKEWYCTIMPLRNITGNFRGIVFTGIDITEQLVRRRLTNWAQLAHDMQTNLSTIRLNAEQCAFNESNENSSRIKKIIYQSNILMQRVRDIVTVGRSDKLNLQVVNARDLCVEVRSEFDEVMFPKVDFLIEADNFNVACDKAKMLRALRNAIENGIKFLKKGSGTIEIKCWNDPYNTYFSIKDDGMGMNEETKEKMLKPYFTTSQKTGGSGIGTMIMQQVIELHGGDIIIKSERGAGTELIFKIPGDNYLRAKRERKK